MTHHYPLHVFWPAARTTAIALLFVLHAGAGAACQPAAQLDDTGTALPWLEHRAAMARQAVRLLRAAPTHGLDPQHYGVDDLDHRLDAVHDATASARLQRDLDAAMIQYLCDLHGGRATSADRAGAAPDPGFDPMQRLRGVGTELGLAQAVDDAAPALPLYHRVRTALAHYRTLREAAPDWPALPPPGRSGVHAGEQYPGSALLRARLRLLGDLDANAPDSDDAVYTPELAAAVQRFQLRHGLDEDGVFGASTAAALAVPPGHRIAQLALTLERLRWLPPPPSHGRVIAVNVPTYRLWAFDTTDRLAAPVLEMRVIVGTGGRTPTPLFTGTMRYLEFDPYWNVPPSILAAEIVPKLARNPAYLQQNDMELVGMDGRVLQATGAEALARLRARTARVRQRPGPRNVLGDVKFAMPNPMNIYLHSTAAKELFQRTRRDLSHGCIRVEQPAELAEFVLADAERWDDTHVAAAMSAGKNRIVTLAAPVPVILFYATALVDRQGRVLFAQDIYRRDQPLIDALHLE